MSSIYVADSNHTKERAEAERRMKERVDGYMTLRKDLDRVLG